MDVHAEIWAMEQESDQQDFNRFCARVQKLLRVRSIDGDDLEDGYSIDAMVDAQDAGDAPEEYVAHVRASAAWQRKHKS